jgi:NADPH:quinone reductase-like Zn-dependent oxidoreductase
MRAVRLHTPGIKGLVVEQVDNPPLRSGEALVRVHAAALTRDELDWPLDRLPAIPSYELSGVVDEIAPGVTEVEIGQPVFALTPFDRDGVAADYAVVAAQLLAPKPHSIDHVQSAALPLAALSAWQGLFDHGRLAAGERVLIHGALGGVGHIAVQLARRHGAHVIGTVSSTEAGRARELGAHEVVDRTAVRFEDAVVPVDLVFDTVGGDVLGRSQSVLGNGGRLVSIAEEAAGATYFVVEPNRAQLIEIASLVDDGALRPEVDSVFQLADAVEAFERLGGSRKHGKVVLRVC